MEEHAIDPVERIKTYQSSEPAYEASFQTFLKHTNQKARTFDAIENIVQSLNSRKLFVDVGAGTGVLTSKIEDYFARTIALEPNLKLANELAKNCPRVPIYFQKLMEADLRVSADFVLCSHVFYYIAQEQWMEHLERLSSWMSPNGVVSVLLQNPESDCMQMLREFNAEPFSLLALKNAFDTRFGDRFSTKLTVVPSEVVTGEFEVAYQISEFVLNSLSIPLLPSRLDLENYVRERFYRPAEKNFRFSCDQDMLLVYAKAQV